MPDNDWPTPDDDPCHEDCDFPGDSFCLEVDKPRPAEKGPQLLYLNGRLRPAAQLALPVWELGLIQGVAVSEQLRTFGGGLFRLQEHLNRLAHSLSIVGIDPGIARPRFAATAERLVAHNLRLVTDGELGLSIFITPGAYLPFSPIQLMNPSRPTVCMHTYSLAVRSWQSSYDFGQRLVVSSHRQIPAACWPPEMKCRSRMHYYLADREAAAKQPGAKALLLDLDGYVCETAIANVVAYRAAEGLITPPASSVLPGISLAVLGELALALDIPWTERRMRVEDLLEADEVLLTSTPWCVMPVTAIDGKPIGNGYPGSTFRRLIEAWSAMVGVDLLGTGVGPQH